MNDYIIIITVIMLITIIGHIMTISLTGKEISETNKQFVLSTKSICDNYLKETESAAYNILNSSNLQPFYTNRQVDDKFIKSAISNLGLVVKTNPVIGKAFLLFNNRDLCISSDSVYNKKIFYEVNYSGYFNSDAECLKAFSDVNIKKFKVIKDARGNTKLLFLYNFVSNYTFNSSKPVLAVFEIDFKNLIEKMNGFSSGNYVIFDSDDNIVYHSGIKPDAALEAALKSNSPSVKFGGRQYISTYAPSDQFGGKYIHLVKKSVYAKTLTTINLITVIIYLICSVFALFFSFVFSKRNYISLVNLLTKAEDSEKKLNEQRSQFHRALLVNFLSGKTNISEDAMLKADFSLPYPYYSVVIFNILDFGIGSQKEDSSSALFCIANVFDELLSGISRNYYCETDGFFVCLVNTGDEDISDIINEKAQFTNKFLNSNFGINFVSVASRATMELSEIPKLYTQSLDTLESRFLFNDTSSINSGDLDKRIAGVKSYIEDNFSDKELSVVSIAEHFNLSSNYLSKYFKTNTGDGLSKYIISRRIEEAKRLLLETNETVNKISDITGFYSPNVFIRSFKKLENTTPGQFRKDCKKM